MSNGGGRSPSMVSGRCRAARFSAARDRVVHRWFRFLRGYCVFRHGSSGSSRAGKDVDGLSLKTTPGQQAYIAGNPEEYGWTVGNVWIKAVGIHSERPEIELSSIDEHVSHWIPTVYSRFIQVGLFSGFFWRLTQAISPARRSRRRRRRGADRTGGGGRSRRAPARAAGKAPRTAPGTGERVPEAESERRGA